MIYYAKLSEVPPFFLFWEDKSLMARLQGHPFKKWGSWHEDMFHSLSVWHSPLLWLEPVSIIQPISVLLLGKTSVYSAYPNRKLQFLFPHLYLRQSDCRSEPAKPLLELWYQWLKSQGFETHDHHRTNILNIKLNAGLSWSSQQSNELWLVSWGSKLPVIPHSFLFFLRSNLRCPPPVKQDSEIYLSRLETALGAMTERCVF